MPALDGLLPRVLSDRQIETMQDGALALLERTGVVVGREDVRRQLRGRAEVHLDGSRARLSATYVADVVEEFGRRSRAARAAAAPEPFRSGPIGHAMHYLDPATDEIRPLTSNDVVAALRLFASLAHRGLTCNAPGFPMDVPAPVRPVKQFKLTLENAASQAAPAPDSIGMAEAIREMSAVVGAPFSLGLHVVSPLRMEGNEFDIAMHYATSGYHISVGTMPTAGVTGPVRLPALFVQAMAEVMGGYALLRLLGVRNCSFWVNAYPADMRHLNLIYGSPEHVICDLMQLAINAYYGVSTAAKGYLTMSKAADMQAAAESASHTAVLALAGARFMGGAGALSLDEMYSPEKLMVDLEIGDHVQRLLRGFEFDAAALAAEAIAEGALAADFIGHSDTLAHYRDVYWMPRLFTHEQLAQWQAAGARTLKERALAETEAAVSGYTFALPCEQQRELDRIYARAEATLLA